LLNSLRLASRFVGISRFETLLDDGEVFILGQRSVLIRIGGGKFLGAQSASQFAPVERSGSLERHVRGSDPWCVVYDREHHRIILHIARIERQYVVVWPREQRSAKTAIMALAIDMALEG
jgi:hypothetical protein